MNIRTTQDKLQDALAILLYLSFVVFASDSRGVFLMIILIIMIAWVKAFNGGFNLKVDMYAKYMFAFGLFSLISSFWAESPTYAIEKGETILELTLAFELLYVTYYEASINRLLKIVMWAGFLLSIYTIMFVGLDALTDTIEDEGRLASSFANINTVGMVACTSILICVYYFLYDNKNYISLMFCLPALYIVAGSGSRKAFVMLIIGIVALFYFKQKYENKERNGVISILLSILILLFLGFLLAESGLFGGTIYRMTRLIDAFTGGDNADNSSLVRAYFRELGFEQFLKTPIYGMGMGNARLLVQHMGKDCYLHCNYAELAANGGIIGLILFYWIYMYLIKKEKKIMSYDKLSILIFLLVILHLIMDYGAVSYYSKRTFFMLMIFVLHIKQSDNRLLHNGNAK